MVQEELSPPPGPNSKNWNPKIGMAVAEHLGWILWLSALCHLLRLLHPEMHNYPDQKHLLQPHHFRPVFCFTLVNKDLLRQSSSTGISVVSSSSEKFSWLTTKSPASSSNSRSGVFAGSGVPSLKSLPPHSP